MIRQLSLMVLFLSIGLSGCDRSANQPPPPPAGKADRSVEKPNATAGAPALARFSLAEEPAGALDVVAFRSNTRAGDEVVFRGLVGGRSEPFVQGKALMTVADLSLKPCNAAAGDNCPTPWDYCCEPPESLTRGTVTVQLVGDDGKVLSSDIRELSGVKPLSQVVVKGKVATHEPGKSTVVNATGIYVKKS